MHGIFVFVVQVRISLFSLVIFQTNRVSYAPFKTYQARRVVKQVTTANPMLRYIRRFIHKIGKFDLQTPCQDMANICSQTSNLVRFNLSGLKDSTITHQSHSSLGRNSSRMKLPSSSPKFAGSSS